MQAFAIWDWEWESDMNEEELKEYHHQKNVEWWQANKNDPERKQRNNDATKRYAERRMASDPEAYRESILKSKREYQKRNYERVRAAMTEEQMEARKAQMREYARRRRAAAKAAKLAAADKEKSNE